VVGGEGGGGGAPRHKVELVEIREILMRSCGPSVWGQGLS
jgi:hypothetical protein